jgi:UDP-glucose:(heptosyl)LPS alpha-1,3-glucosyltransferase
LKIALVILHADPARGGAERYTADIGAALAARGHGISLLACDFGPAIPGVEFVRLSTRGPTRRGKFLGLLNSLDKHVARQTYDVVHAMLPVRRCDFYHPHAGLAIETIRAGHRKYRPGLRLAAMAANRLNLKRQAAAGVEQKLLTSKAPPVVICLSDYVKQSITEYYDLPADRLVRLFNAVDLNRFDPHIPRERAKFSIDAGKIVALMVAQDFARKGVSQAISAVAGASDARLMLLVVGRDDPSSYKRLASKLGISGQIRFVGAVDDPRPLYRLADFFVLPTRHDPCSLATLEALAMGLPVISTVFNGACEIMTHGRHGFILPDPEDASGLAESMKELLDNRTRQAMHENCLQLRPQLSFDHHIDRLLTIYRDSKSAQKSAAR